MLPAVNFHLWEPCNMRCQFCFATFQDVKSTILPKGHLPKKDAIDLISQLAELGFEKITFAGGEPTLCPWLHDLIKTAHQIGLTTMVVTNGSNLTDSFLLQNKDYLDWIALSVDSLNSSTNLKTGRAIIGKKTISTNEYYSLVDKIKFYGYGLKINTVVNSTNYNEDLTDFIKYAKPKRWKVLQALPIQGQNDDRINDFTISEDEFDKFSNNHNVLQQQINVVFENNEAMLGSYAMVDPAGRFFDNSAGVHRYSESIIEIGARSAIQQVSYDLEKFKDRQGLYNWKKKN